MISESQSTSLLGWASLVAIACLLAITAFEISSGAISNRGFPLDDAWIHEVYARELSRSGTLAYNPGEASTGATSPLWPLVLVPVHWLSNTPGTVIQGTKFVGFLLHLVGSLGVSARQVVHGSG